MSVGKLQEMNSILGVIPRQYFEVSNMKNLCNKERKKEDPYEIWTSFDGSWSWRVLKKWQADDNKPYARWFCAVKSPYTFDGYDIGDVYVKDIKQNAVLSWTNPEV